MVAHKCDISPWRVVINAFRYKGWAFMANRSFSSKEVFLSMQRYGVKIIGRKELFYPTQLNDVADDAIGYFLRDGEPVIALFNKHHEVCVVDCYRRGKDWYYTIIDSSDKKKPYRELVNPDLQDFQNIS